MMTKALYSIALISILLVASNSYHLYAQNNLSPTQKAFIENSRALRLMFYNCENLFDTENDSLTNDEEFLPNGDRFWNDYKYKSKLNKISKVIIAAGGWNAPELVALCEIENRKVLDDLNGRTQLYMANYSIIHKESPDKRGIDVALFYQKKNFKPLHTQFIQVDFPFDGSRPTRDILYTKGLAHGSDTLHIFVNHWPSRWGGQLESENKRVFVASLLRQKVDSILINTSNAKIIIVGDLNDEPNNKSVHEELNAKLSLNALNKNELYNLTYIANKGSDNGSHRYRANWGILDHIIVSGALLIPNNLLFTNVQASLIFKAPFLLEKDDNYLGQKPFRTFIGYKYNDGYSDHLPVLLDLNMKE